VPNPNKQVFVRGKPFQPSLMILDKNKAYSSEAPVRCSTLYKASGLTYKHYTRQERLARNNHKILGTGWKGLSKTNGARAVHRKGLSPKGLFTECPLVWALTEHPY
jgi:hypothetical protein